MIKKTFLTIICFLASLSFLTSGSFGADVCVDSASALQSALTTAQSSGESDIIRVEQGLYTQSIKFSYSSTLGHSITLEGGYVQGTSCSQRVLDPTNTIIDGNNSKTVLYLKNSTNGGDITVDGFTIRNGNTPTYSGGGVHAESTSSSGAAGNITLANNIITGNTASTYQGGGLYVLSRGNSSAYAGTVTLINNIVTGNNASSTGSYGGGIYLSSNSNSFAGETVTLINNTITDNAAGVNGGGIYIGDDNNTIYVYNNIIWGNTAAGLGDDIYLIGSGSTSYGYNNNYSDMDGTWDYSSGETDVDPEFIDPDNGDFRLRSSSPCMDAGETNVPNPPDLPTYDFEGDTRIIEDTIDIGADEVSIVTTCASVSGGTTLQQALTAAQANGKGDVIMVQEGTYNGNFSYSSSQGYDISVLGGYTSGCSSRVIDPENTVLDAEGSGKVLSLNNTAGGDIMIEGLTIQNGNNSQASGIETSSTSTTGDSGNISIKTNNITDNIGAGSGVNAKSESDSNTTGDIIIADNTISGNTGALGGGVRAYTLTETGTAGSIILQENTISGNTATGTQGGGGVYASSNSSSSGKAGTVTLTGNIIRDNTANLTAGVYAGSKSNAGDSSAVTLVNNIIAENTATAGSAGGVMSKSEANSGTPGAVTFTNNTITGNSATTTSGGVRLFSGTNENVYCYNNIIWGNTAPSGGDITLISTSGTAISYNNNYLNMSGSWDTESGTISSDPKLSSDCHLRPGSPCIDAGTNAAQFLPSTDIDGDDRTIDGNRDDTATVDIGADEYIPKGTIAHFLMLLLN